MNPDAFADQLREELVAAGFSDDGRELRGIVAWQPTTDTTACAVVTIRLPDTFPFRPPAVRLLHAGADLVTTFHQDRSETLCLWEDRWPTDEAPWRRADGLVARIRGWLELAAAGWPDDDSCDLERYLPIGDAFVVYDSDAVPVGVPVHLRSSSNGAAIVVTDRPAALWNRQQRRARARAAVLVGVVHDLGSINRPLRSWQDVVAVLPSPDAAELIRLVADGTLAILLLRYRHGTGQGTLALQLHASGDTVDIAACESADMNTATRHLRAGRGSTELRELPIAVVGAGAIGSFAIAGLYRSGFRDILLCDDERLRPGNVIRHLAGLSHVGELKTAAVRVCLADIDPDIDQIRVRDGLHTLEDAIDLLRHHQVVVDATASARTSSMLAVAADLLGESASSLVSVCVQHDGDIARTDRWPLRHEEQHLPSPPERSFTATELHEHGCGSPVSPTPPHAVQAAANLAVRATIDEALHQHRLPATLVQELTPSEDLVSLPLTDRPLALR